MLEHVALNQTRFHTPGIAPDPRGVVLGKLGAFLFPGIDQLVGFFAILSDELSLDDLLPTLKLVEVRTPLRSREFLVLIHAASSYLLDRGARVSRLLGGLAFTGSGKHFVKYRDDVAPLGYDVTELSTENADYLLYSDAFTQAYARVREIAFSQLVFRLSLRRLPGGAETLRGGDRERLWLVVERGLGKSVITYLWRNRVDVAASWVEREASQGGFRAAGGYLLVRVNNLPERMLNLFEAVPGIEVYRPLGENFVVEAGYRHPIRLEACQSLFDKERFYVFSGKRDEVDVVVGPPPLTAGDRLVAMGFDLGADRLREGKAPAGSTTPLQVELKLVPSSQAPHRVTATLVGWERADWLKKLVFAVPPTVLINYRVAPVEEGLMIIGQQGIDGLPIGELFQEAAPSIYIPVGFEFLPRVSEAVLTDHVGGINGRVIVFRRGAPAPIAIADGDFEPLGRRMLGRLEVEMRARSERLPSPVTVEAEVRNDPVGPLPLWGFRGGPPPDVDL